jgi:hypothetical protein
MPDARFRRRGAASEVVALDLSEETGLVALVGELRSSIQG